MPIFFNNTRDMARDCAGHLVFVYSTVVVLAAFPLLPNVPRKHIRVQEPHAPKGAEVALFAERSLYSIYFTSSKRRDVMSQTVAGMVDYSIG